MFSLGLSLGHGLDSETPSLGHGLGYGLALNIDTARLGSALVGLGGLDSTTTRILVPRKSRYLSLPKS